MKYYFEIYKHKDILTKRLIHDFLKTIELKGLKEYRKEQSLMMKLLEEAESKITYVKTNKKNK